MKSNTASIGFKALMCTQFMGAFNDNFLKTSVLLLIVKEISDPGQESLYMSVAGAMFVVPFLLFSAYAGPLADRISKHLIIRAVKWIEVLIALVALYLFWLGSIFGLMAVIFALGFHSTFFSPPKYGILPEILETKDLSRGNGFLEFWTFTAILVGTAVSGVVLKSAITLLPGVVALIVAGIGLSSSYSITAVKPAESELRFKLNPYLEIFETIAEICSVRGLFLTLIGTTYFWFVGALVQLNLLVYAESLVKTDELGTAFLITALTFGIGVGSIYTGKVSEGKVELGLVPIGSFGLAIFGALLSISYNSIPFTALTLFLFGLSAGIFSVPLNAYFQKNSPERKRGRYLAANNFIVYLGILGASFAFWLFGKLALSSAEVFLSIGLLSIFIGVYIITIMPETFVRCINWIITHTVYRLKVVGAENVPEVGGALIVSNHVSYVDASLIQASLGRPVRFIMFGPIYEIPLISWVAKAMRTIPIYPGKGRRGVIETLQLAKSMVAEGEIVCIFAEGSITRTGNLLPFKKGFETIMDGLDAPIIPAYLDQVWGSIFSFEGKRFIWKWPRKIPYQATLLYGKPMPASSKAQTVRQSVQELSAEAVQFRPFQDKDLASAFIAQVKRTPFRNSISDSTGQSLNFLSTLVVGAAFSRRLKKLTSSKMVAVLMPPSVGGALANIAATLTGLVPVNLNYTAGEEAIGSALTQCQIENIISSRKFCEKLKLERLKGLVFIEDLIGEVGILEKFILTMQVLILPQASLRQRFAATRDAGALATVIFSSGSTAQPKGVMLTQLNITSNIEAIYQLFQLGSKDCMLGVLPFFHSFGFTVTLWFPLLTGMRAVYHYNPIDAGTIGKLIAEKCATVLLATPTFLSVYLKKCETGEFATLKHVIVGAEKLKPELAQAFAEKFGLRPLEGYGCTELSPVAAINTPDFSDGKNSQAGSKIGKAGHPLPNVAAKIVDPDTFVELTAEQDGLLLIKGPNVMNGYLNKEEMTKEVIRDGWYVTGDIANFDQDGFIQITDRLSRFSKIGGEMVPHIKIEEQLQAIHSETSQVFIVTAVSDEKRGESLVVFHTIDIDPVAVNKSLAESGLPNLWIPKRDYYFRIESIPLLGSGKIDLKAVKALAQTRVGGAS